MQMTDAEILQSYRGAKDPVKQISVLADLNWVKEAEMARKLQALGVSVEIPPEKPQPVRKPPNPTFDVGRALELHAEGLCDLDIAERLGVKQSNFAAWRRGQGLKANVKKAEKTKKQIVQTEPPVQETVSLPEQVTLEPPHEAPWRIAGEVLRTYIICEDEQENVWLIDKHAAHERVRFDALKAAAEPIMSQTLLEPMAVELSPEDCAAVLEQLPLLERYGFRCEDFGGAVLVREVPGDIDDPAGALEELAEDLRLNRADPDAARDSLLSTMACKSAIKAGMYTDPAELRRLVDRVQSGEIQYCPHGRPVAVKLSKYQVEKMFKRA